YVSFWEAEWQLSSLFLLVISPVLSVIVTTYVTSKSRVGGLNKQIILKLISTIVVLAVIFSSVVYFFNELLLSTFFNSMMIVGDSSIELLLLINLFRLVSVVIFYILYVISDTKKLVFGELFFLLTFALANVVLKDSQVNSSIPLLISVLICFLYFILILVKTDEYKTP
ncbi:hypothetical protein O1B37_003597, partial [Vibrio cholerae]|nr:hypothetical protein [Vibrio cholerae]